MRTTRTLMLATLAALSLGVGSAMASGTGAGTGDYWAAQYRAQAARQAAVQPQAATPQYGSSDMQPSMSNQIETNSMAIGGG